MTSGPTIAWLDTHLLSPANESCHTPCGAGSVGVSVGVGLLDLSNYFSRILCLCGASHARDMVALCWSLLAVAVDMVALYWSLLAVAVALS